MSERNIIREIGLPDRERQWNFFVMVDGKAAPVVARTENGCKHLMVGGEPPALLTLATADLTSSGDDLETGGRDREPADASGFCFAAAIPRRSWTALIAKTG